MSAAGVYTLMSPPPVTRKEAHTLPEEEAQVTDKILLLLEANWSNRRDTLVDDKPSLEAVLIINVYLSNIIEGFVAPKVSEGKLKGEDCIAAICQYLSHTDVQYLAAIDANEKYSAIRQFCTTEPLLLACWREHLKKYKHPDFPFSFVDGSGRVDEFTMFMGCYYFGRYMLWKQYLVNNCNPVIRESFLDLACKLEEPGTWTKDEVADLLWLYYISNQPSQDGTPEQKAFLDLACKSSDPFAWLYLLMQDAAQLFVMCYLVGPEEEPIFTRTEEKVVPEEKCVSEKKFISVVKHMLKTAEDMGNHFWSPGYFLAGVVLEKTAVTLAKNKGQMLALETFSLPAPEDVYPLALQLMAGSVRCYYAAFLLSGAIHSRQIASLVYSRGYFSAKNVEGHEGHKKSILRQLEKKFFLSMPKIFTERIFSEVVEKLEPVLEALQEAQEAEETKQSSSYYSFGL